MTLLIVLYVALFSAAEQPAPHVKAAEAAYKKGEASRSLLNWSSAEASYLRAIDIEPTYIEAYRGLIAVYRATSRTAECAQILTRLLQIQPDSVGDRLVLGGILMDGREWMRALAQFTEAVRLDPQNADALYWFARAAEESGMTDRAREAAELGRKRFPQDKRFRPLVEASRHSSEDGPK